ncbi:MAG TPA: hypothetical protein VNZ86_12920, partial [Bacteroidia bacterium]|nr:hypothetical protein [Bacteroidia bacterium]
MKIATRLLGLIMAAGITTFCCTHSALFSGQKNEHTLKTAFPTPKEEAGKDAPEDVLWEFKLLRNPETGLIPVDARPKEQALLKQFKEERKVNPLTEGSTFFFLGPYNVGGRTRALAYDIRNTGIILAGGVSGDLFRSTDGGISWTSVLPNARATCLAQDPRPGYQDRWYMGTGEAGRGNSASSMLWPLGVEALYVGDGLWVSNDNGMTWSSVNSPIFNNNSSFDLACDFISKVVISPINGYVYVAGCGAIFRGAPTGKFGIMSWYQVLGPANGLLDKNATTDLAISTSGRLYAAFSGHMSASWDGVWTSTTGNTNMWNRIAGNGSPAGWQTSGNYGRIALGMAGSDHPNALYALFDCPVQTCDPSQGPQGGNLWQLQYSGSTVTAVNKSANLPNTCGNAPFNTYNGYCMGIVVKPDDYNTVIIGGDHLYMSTNGWSTSNSYNLISQYPTMGDFHTLLFQPASTTMLTFGCDQGIYTGDITSGGGYPSWTSINQGYISSQYYSVGINNDPSQTIQCIGGLQDNGTYAYDVTVGTNQNKVTGADGFSCALDGSNIYSTWQYGGLLRNYDQSASIAPASNKSSFFTLFRQDPVSPNVLYYVNGNDIWRTTSASTAYSSSGWTQLTGNFVSGLTYFNGTWWPADEITSISTTSGAYNSTTSCLYYGTANGGVYRLNDPKNCAASTNATAICIGAFGNSWNGHVIKDIAVDPSNPNNVMFVVSNYGIKNIYMTTNALDPNPVWADVSGNLGYNVSIRSCAITSGPSNTPLYYVGTSIGLFSTSALSGTSTSWTLEGPGVINGAIVNSLSYRPADNILLVGTHGNGMFVAQPGKSPTPASVWSEKGIDKNEVSVFPNPVPAGSDLNVSY